MIEYARILAKPFPQVRVDFYDIEGKSIWGTYLYFAGRYDELFHAGSFE